MRAIRLKKTVKNKKITLTLPETYNDKKVEVIVLPISNNNLRKLNKTEQFKRMLLNGPTLSEEEITEFSNVRRWMNEWRRKEY